MKKIISFGLISFLLAALWLTPLAYLSPQLTKINNKIIMQEPSGTVWDGKVKHLTINNQYLGAASWKVNPLQSLTSFSLKGKFRLDSNDITAFGIAGIGLNETLKIDKTQFDVKAHLINKLQKNAKLTGNFKGFIEHAEIKQDTVPKVDAVVNWQSGALEAPIKLTEGNYRAVIKPEGENLDIKLSSTEAPIELNGNIQLLKDWTFKTNIITKSTNPGLMAMMKFAGKPHTDGAILIQQNGDLKPFIGIN